MNRMENRIDRATLRDARELLQVATRYLAEAVTFATLDAPARDTARHALALSDAALWAVNRLLDEAADAERA